jgi:hypothetical protein
MIVSRISIRLLGVALFVPALLLLIGCGPSGPKTAPVKGTITYKGAPVPQGTIMFQPDSGPAATAEINNGAYVLKTFRDGDGAVLGNHKVTVISLANQKELLPEERKPLPPPMVPLDYSFPDKSGLTAVVEDKVNIFNFDLKDRPAP